MSLYKIIMILSLTSVYLHAGNTPPQKVQLDLKSIQEALKEDGIELPADTTTIRGISDYLLNKFIFNPRSLSTICASCAFIALPVAAFKGNILYALLGSMAFLSGVYMSYANASMSSTSKFLKYYFGQGLQALGAASLLLTAWKSNHKLLSAVGTLGLIGTKWELSSLLNQVMQQQYFREGINSSVNVNAKVSIPSGHFEASLQI